MQLDKILIQVVVN